MTRSNLQHVKEGVQATQSALRDIKTLQQQIDNAQGQRAAGQENVAQLIQDKLEDLQIFQQQSETTQNWKSAEYQAALQEPISHILAGQQQIKLKLRSIEAGFKQNTAFQARAITQSILGSFGELDRTPTFQSLRITATVVCKYGVESCQCNCHCHRRPTKRTPKALDRFIGILFVGYFGLPYVNEPCDDTDCAQRSGFNIRLAYIFPTWLLTRALVFLLNYSPVRGPELNIRVPRIVSNNSRILTCAINGDVDGMREMPNHGLGSPMDIDITSGCTPLMVNTLFRDIS